MPKSMALYVCRGIPELAKKLGEESLDALPDRMKNIQSLQCHVRLSVRFLTDSATNPDTWGC